MSATAHKVGEPIQVQTDVYNEIIDLPCPAPRCRAQSHAPCSDRVSWAPGKSRRRVVAPHKSRVAQAGYGVVPHPQDVAVRWYAKVSQ